MKRTVHAPISELLRVFEFSSDEMTYYLNIETGKFAMYSNLSGGFDEDGNEMKGSNVFADEKYVEISGTHSYEIFRDMERFVASISDSPLKTQLTQSLRERGAFRRFKEELMSHLLEQERWLRFRKECMLQRVHDWLEENDLELE
ncbi:MAG: hypothetical protein KAW12_03655 [Candidatus Aminicenantes bacterium]|nr:hypothetical protein [Candidatus Aminicenantes bacterium]